MRMSKLFQGHLIRELISFTLLVIILSLFFSLTLRSHLIQEFTNRGTAISNSLANSSVELLLNRDASTIQALIDQFLDSSSGVAYLFVVNEQLEVIAHTFVPHIPAEMLDVAEGQKAGVLIRDVTIPEHGQFIDITAPILAGVVGYVHVGMDQALINASIQSVIIQQIVLISIIFLISVIVAYIQANRVSQPLLQLAEFAREVSTTSTYAEAVTKVKWLLLERQDEVGQLTRDFQSMVQQIYVREEALEQRREELAKANAEITALNQRLAAENHRMGVELDVNRQLQQMLLPTPEELQAIEGLDLAGFMQPADEVGGDYYDVLTHNGHVKIAIGDVTGHGLESGVLMLMTQTAVRTLLTSEVNDPARFLSILNRTIYLNVQRMNANKSLSLALLDYSPPSFLCSNNGIDDEVAHLRLSGQHEELIVVRQGGKIERIDTLDLGFPIGLDDDISHLIGSHTIQLNAGDGVVLYTDGITEAECLTGEQYGLERLCEVISRYWQEASAESIKEAVLEDLRSFIGEQKVYDDLTLLVLKQR